MRSIDTARDTLATMEHDGTKLSFHELSKALDAIEAELVSLSEENDRLRELVEEMLSCIEIRAAFGRPPTTDMYEQFAKCASELGIEVEP